MTLSGETKKMAMSSYDMLVQEGIIQGIEQGIEQKNRLVIKEGINAGLSIELLAKLTALPEEAVFTIIQSLEEEAQQ
ncbi:MAG: hypothetical protein R2828_01235 [Saprospiraceae bacterium]